MLDLIIEKDVLLSIGQSIAKALVRLAVDRGSASIFDGWISYSRGCMAKVAGNDTRSQINQHTPLSTA